MRRYRDHAEVIRDILAEIKRGRNKKSWILASANLCHRRSTKYLDQLVARGHVEVTETSKPEIYSITSKGRHLLATLRKAYEELEDL